MENNRGHINWTAAGVFLSFVISAITASFVFGEMRGDIRHNKEDIQQLQADGRTMTAALSRIEATTARIDGRLSVFFPESAEKQQGTR